MKIYIAMAQLNDGSRAIESAYTSYDSAFSAAAAMVEDMQKNGGMNSIPIVEEMDLIDG
jgi:hypothetical protein